MVNLKKKYSLIFVFSIIIIIMYIYLNQKYESEYKEHTLEKSTIDNFYKNKDIFERVSKYIIDNKIISISKTNIEEINDALIAKDVENIFKIGYVVIYSSTYEGQTFCMFTLDAELEKNMDVGIIYGMEHGIYNVLLQENWYYYEFPEPVDTE